MNCIEFRRLITADPANTSASATEHRRECDGCARYADEMKTFDRQLRKALDVDAGRDLEARIVLAGAARERQQRRWMAMAATVLLGIGVTFGLLVSGGGDPLANDVIAHVYHEPHLLDADAEPMPAELLRAVLRRAGVSLNGDMADVTYAGPCYFRGSLVPHLVVRGQHGPVTVMLMPNEAVEHRRTIRDKGFRGFHGIIVPVGQGSIAVVGAKEEPMEIVERRFMEAVEWDI